MKQKIFYFASIVCMFAALASCNKDPEYFTLPDQPDQMHIKASVSEIVLDKSKANEVALTLSWDKAVSPISPDDSVAYFIRFFDPSLKNIHITDTIPVGSATSKSFTHDELNNIMSKWVMPEIRMEITAQLLCYVFNKQTYVKPIQSMVTFAAKGYEKYPTYLFLRFTDKKTSKETVVPIQQKNLGSGVYVYEGTVSPSTFVIGTASNAEFPLYAKAEGEQMNYVAEGSYEPFECNVSGERTILVDINSEYNDCRIVNVIKLPADHIWIVGDATGIGWKENDQAGYFQNVGTAREPWIWSWTGEFFAPKEQEDGKMSEGTFKLGLESNFQGQFFFAKKNNADPTVDTALDGPRTGNPDNKWLISEKTAGLHTITLYLLADNPHMVFE